MADMSRYPKDTESAAACDGDDDEALLGHHSHEAHHGRFELLEMTEHVPHCSRSKLTNKATHVFRWLWNPRLRTKTWKLLRFLTVCYLSFVGLLHTVGNFLQTHFPDDMDELIHRLISDDAATIGVGHWLSGATQNVYPVRCHSHNDYWRDRPLFDAIAAGCPSVEADVWHQYHDLYVGHRQFQLHTDRTLRSLYIDPLIELLEKRNRMQPCVAQEGCGFHPRPEQPLDGVFKSDPDQSLILLVDFKSAPQSTWQELQTQLIPLRQRNFVTHYNGTHIVPSAITVVASGNAPFANIIKNNDYRDIFYDAPLEELGNMSDIWPNPNRVDHERFVSFHKKADRELSRTSSGSQLGLDTRSQDSYGISNSYYASANFKTAVGHVWGSRLSQHQLQLIRSQVRGAHEVGLKVRYWGIPAWPIGLRNHIWHILIREGVDVLSVDDLRQATTWDWRKGKGLLF